MNFLKNKINSLKRKKDKVNFKNKNKERKKFKLKYLPLVLSRTEKIIILVLAFAAIGSIGWILFDFYCRHVKIEPDYGGHYIEGAIGGPQYINPLFSSANDVDMDISSLVYSGLMKYDYNQELITDIAERYEISEDGKNYTFFLKKNIVWHDNEPLTADDIVFTVQSIKNPDYQSSLMNNFNNVAVEKIDDYTIKFTLVGETLSPFLKENTTFGILPKHIWQEISPKNALLADYNLRPVGSGPFKFQEFKKDKKTGLILSYTLEKNKDFYNGSPYLDKITFKFYNEYYQLIEALNKQEISGISYIPPEENQNIKDNIKKDIFFYNLKLPRYYSLFFNQPKNEALQDKNVRQALAYATNKEEIINEVLGGQGIPIDSPILESFLGYNPELKKYEYDKNKANNILHEAGYTDIDESGVRSKDDIKLEFKITTTNQNEFVQLVNIIKSQWQEAGIEVILETIDPTELQTEYIRPRNYEILLYGQLIGHDPDPYPFWHSSQRIDPGLNLTSFKDPTADDLLETARKTSDEESRRLKYLHFQNIIAEELPALFLCSPTYSYAINKKVRGVKLEFITIPSDRLSNAKDWFIEINRRWK